MNRNKKISSIIVLVIFLLFMVQGFANADSVIYFTDVNEKDWHYDAVTRGASKGLIYGYTDRTFKPEKNISLKEFLALYGRALVLIPNKNDAKEIVKPESFNISKDSWAYREIQNVFSRIDLDLISSVDISDINRPITREEVAFFVNSSLNLKPIKESKSQLSDVGGTKFEAEINNLYGNNIVLGYPDNSFKPSDQITRAELVKIINNLY